jgi:alcohol dehydrogenase YqhD (iron-dependent ADH family)
MSINNFTVYNPTRLHFGKGVVETLGETVKKYSNKVLLVYGKESVKKYGYYDEVVNQLTDSGIEWIEYGGIKPNPVIEDVRKAVAFGKENNVRAVVALGGGSVIDSSKIIAAAIATGIEPWDIVSWKTHPKSSLPLICILTLAATGTEMNAAAVVQNEKTKEKLGYVNPVMFPAESFLDPEYTTTVPENYTVYGIVDLIAHALEAFYGAGEPSVIDKITLDIISDAMKHSPALLADLTNYDLRANIMLDATLALNGLTSYGKTGGDWAVHGIGHEISLLFDTPHGATLSIAYPAWLKLQKERIPDRILTMGKGLFGATTVDESIEKLEAFFVSVNSPVRLSDTGLADKAPEILEQLNRNKVSGMHHVLTESDHARLVELMK